MEAPLANTNQAPGASRRAGLRAPRPPACFSRWLALALRHPRLRSLVIGHWSLVITSAFALGLLAPASLRAFPPAPFYTLYGTVRDEDGHTLRVAGAALVLYRDGVEILRQELSEGARLDQNYQLRLRMDMFRSNTSAYTAQAHATGVAFTLAIIINNVAYYPIEMSTSRTVGKPGERIRLDLTLGVDSDGDGLPDAWEQSQLYAAGILPGENGWDLSLIDKHGDFDGDGVSNWDEYIAGTYATDPTDYLSLQIVEPLAAHMRLRFFSIYGKVYSLETSADLKTWTAYPFYLRNPESAAPEDLASPPAAQTSLTATATDFAELYAPAGDTGRNFYRLRVR